MPLYNYRCDAGHENQIFHSMAAPVRSTCEVGDCKAAARIVVQKVPAMRIPHHLKGMCYDYREDLARFPGDPRAYVDGPRALSKLIDQTKREGAEVRPVSEAWKPSAASLDVPEEEEDASFQEAYEEAVQELNEEE